MQNQTLNKPVGMLSVFGKAVVRMLWTVFRASSKKSIHANYRNFEENPATMSFKESWYLGYKYYFRSPMPEKKATDFFVKNPPIIKMNIMEAVSISLGGDLMPYKLINSKTCKNLWNRVGDRFFDADLVFANLETPIVKTVKPQFVPELMLHHMNFNASQEQFEIFNGNGKFKGYDVLSFANNHTYDQGEFGIKSTTDFLQEKGIVPLGVRTSLELENDCAIFERKGIKIGWLAYTFCTNHHIIPENKKHLVNSLRLNHPDCDFSTISEKVQNLRQQGADFIIGSFHMGNAYQPLPNWSMIQQVTRLINETGVDAFVGTHPHNLQPNALIKNQLGKEVPVIFSLGDFVAWDIYTYGHLCQTVSLEIARNQSGEAVVQLFESQPIYCQLSKKRELEFIPLKELEQNPSFFQKNAFVKGEVQRILRYYKQYMF